MRRFALGAFALVCIIGALQLRMGATQAQAGPDASRQRALEQASSLLAAPPQAESAFTSPAAHAGVIAAATPAPGLPGGLAAATNDSPLPHALAARPPGETLAGVSAPVSNTPPGAAQNNASIEPGAPPLQGVHGTQATQLNRLPWQGSGGQLPKTPIPTVRAASYPIDASAGNGEPIGPYRYFARTQRRAIPEKIEAAPSPIAEGDALATLNIAGGLRVIDGKYASVQLAAVRTDGAHPRIQLRVRGASASTPPGSGWLETGDSATGGWLVVAIARDNALLLSPRGNPYRLRLSASAATPASPGAPPPPAIVHAPEPRPAP